MRYPSNTHELFCICNPTTTFAPLFYNPTMTTLPATIERNWQKLFLFFCRHDQFDEARQVLYTYPTKVPWNDQLFYACAIGDLAVVKVAFDFANTQYRYDSFRLACARGDVSIVQWWHTTKALQCDQLDFCVNTATSLGHLAMVQWVLQTWPMLFGTTSIHFAALFVRSCFFGHLQVAQ
jgi:hypothetical protein